jgi:hypothetical protein
LNYPARDEAKAGYGDPAIRDLPRPDGYHRAAYYLIDFPYGQETLEATVHYRGWPERSREDNLCPRSPAGHAGLIHFVNVI